MDPLNITFETLAATPNGAADAVLITALDAASPDVQRRAVQAILKRHSRVGHRVLLRRWPVLDAEYRHLIGQHGGRFGRVVREGLVGSDKVLRQNAYQALQFTADYELIPTLVKLIEQQRSRHHRAPQALLLLAEQFCQELTGPRNYQRRVSLLRMRQHAEGVLEEAVKRFKNHQQLEVVEAFLMLVRCENVTLKHILHSPQDALYYRVTQILGSSPRPSINRLLLGFLDDRHIPQTILNILTQRKDAALLEQFTARCNRELSVRARSNLRKLKSFAWLESNLDILNSFPEREQTGVVQLLQLSGVPRDDAFAVIGHLVRYGKAEARRAAIQTLAEYEGAAANRLVVEALDDPDPDVQAVATVQLRTRGIRGAMSRLLEMVDSPHEIVRHAARAELKEFNIRRYLAVFDTLDPTARRTSGQLVKKIDPRTVPQLEIELGSRSRPRMLRALEVISELEYVERFEQSVGRLAESSDQFLRSAAVRALGGSQTANAQEILNSALRDRSAMVRSAAQEGLARWEHSQLAGPSSPADEVAAAEDRASTYHEGAVV